jgi:hypothetical protein
MLNFSRYNSAVFETVTTNEYNVIVVTEGFLSGAPWSYHSDLLTNGEFSPNSNFTVQRLQDNVTALERLSNAACMMAYQNSLLSDRSNLLAVTSAKAINSSNLLEFLPEAKIYDPYPNNWICSYRYTSTNYPCDVSSAVQHADLWKIADKPIEYCLSERVDERCKLQFSQTIMIVVIVCNGLKICCMLSAILRRSGEALVTTG